MGSGVVDSIESLKDSMMSRRRSSTEEESDERTSFSINCKEWSSDFDNFGAENDTMGLALDGYDDGRRNRREILFSREIVKLRGY